MIAMRPFLLVLLCLLSACAKKESDPQAICAGALEKYGLRGATLTHDGRSTLSDGTTGAIIEYQMGQDHLSCAVMDGKLDDLTNLTTGTEYYNVHKP